MTTSVSFAGADRATLRASSEIRAWSGRLRLTNRDLGAIIGVSHAQVSQRLLGRVTWSVDELELLADAFGATVSELIPPRSERPTPTPTPTPPPAQRGRVISAAPALTWANGAADNCCSRLGLAA